MRRWQIDKQAIYEALKTLGIKRKVHVEVLTQLRDEQGRIQQRGVKAQMRWDQRNKRYEVQLRSDLTPKEATHALWHELAHCRQYEKLGVKEAAFMYVLASDLVGYTNNPLELDAEKVARKHEHKALVMAA